MGIRAGVLALVIKALVSMYKKCPKGIFGYILMGVAFVISAFTNINIIFIIIACALVGLIYSVIMRKRGKEVCRK